MDRAEQVAQTKETIGWLYPELPWFSDQEARAAQEERDELLRSLPESIAIGAGGTKPHLGPISPGCAICGSGGWECIFFNSKCSRRCSFCPQPRELRTAESLPQVDGIPLATVEDHLRFLSCFPIGGIGFTGGEPLLQLDELLTHLRAIRNAFGSSMYLWAYTNGDMLDEAAARQLARAGLNELRFDLTARDYDASPLAIARAHIPTVTVEVPVLPHQFGQLRQMLRDIARQGVDYVNLHQAYVTPWNYRGFLHPGYHFLHQPQVMIHESEICALRLLHESAASGARLPIQYCCGVYKHRYTNWDRRTRYAAFLRAPYEEITQAGYLRCIRVADSTARTEALLRRVEARVGNEKQLDVHHNRTEIAIPGELLAEVESDSAEISITYSEPKIRLAQGATEFSAEHLLPLRRVVHEERAWQRTTARAWLAVYGQGESVESAVGGLWREFPLSDRESMARLTREAHGLERVREYEVLALGMADVF